MAGILRENWPKAFLARCQVTLSAPPTSPLRAHLIAVRLELERCPDDPPEWLACNPYYVAALAGDPATSDAYMDGDDSLRKAWLKEVAKLRRDAEI